MYPDVIWSEFPVADDISEVIYHHDIDKIRTTFFVKIDQKLWAILKIRRDSWKRFDDIWISKKWQRFDVERVKSCAT